MLDGQEFGAMDSATSIVLIQRGISFIINCTDQNEIDDYLKKISAVPAANNVDGLKTVWFIVADHSCSYGELLGRNPKKNYSRTVEDEKIIIADLIKAAEEK